MVFALLLVATSANACSWGMPDRRLQQEISSYYEADVVFLARLKEPQGVPFDGTHQYAMLVADYDLIDSYRGNPPSHGTIATEDRREAGRDGVPPNSCTGWLLYPGIGGKEVIIFARKGDDLYPYLINAQSTQFSPTQAGSQDQLQRLRLYKKYEETP